MILKRFNLPLFKYYREEWSRYGTKRFLMTRLFYIKSKISERCRKWVRFNIRPIWQISDAQLTNTWRTRHKNIFDLLSEWEKNIEKSFFISPYSKNAFSTFMAKEFPHKVNVAITKADEIMENVYDILGSGTMKLSDPPQWDTDIKSGYRYGGYSQDIRNNIYHENIKNKDDAKVAWELSRFSFALILGKAYWYSGDEKYAEKYVRLLSDWFEKNPYDWGVNWICPMEVAIRSVGIMWGYFFFRFSKHFTQRLKIQTIKSLIQHAYFIAENLEGNPYGNYNNHYFTNGFGLFFLGIFLKNHSQGMKWLSKGLKIIEKETVKQILPDGVHYEQSIGYHRLILDILLSTIILARKNKINLSNNISSTIEKMLDFTLDCTRDDGTVPSIADYDDGRLMNLAADVYINDHRGTLSTGCVVLRNSKWNTGIFYEETFWLTDGIDGWKSFNKLPSIRLPSNSKAYEESGYYIMKNKNIHIIADCGAYGLHGHNDLLGFDLYAFGRPMICDPGTYQYSFHYKWSNKFRSTYSHNVVGIDGKEANPFNDSLKWGDKKNEYEKLIWISNEKLDLLTGRHFNYKYLQDDLIHQRKMLLDKEEGIFFIHDDIIGSGTHTVLFIFNVAPGLKPVLTQPQKAGVLSIDNQSKGILIQPLKNSQSYTLKPRISKSWVSWEFGRKIPAYKIYYVVKTSLPFSMQTALIPCFKTTIPVDFSSLLEKCIKD